MKLFSPQNRRILTYAASGILGGAAARQAAAGSFQSAHYFAMASTAALLLPTLIRNSRCFGSVTTDFSTSRREVWVTIDDGPHPENTPEILEVLGNHGAKATFFGIGRNILQWPHLARAVISEGHQLQNHTFHHQAGTFWAALPNRVRKEIELCNSAIRQTTGVESFQFRAPVGIANPFVHAIAEQAGLQMIGWSATGLDGIPHQPERVVQKILRNVRPGAIILIHEGSLPGLRKGVRAQTLDALLRKLSENGYKAVVPSLATHGATPLLGQS